MNLSRNPIHPDVDDLELRGHVACFGLVGRCLAAPLGHFYFDDPRIDSRTPGTVDLTIGEQG